MSPGPGIVLVFTYALIALSAIVVRLQKRDLPEHYKMPLWPLWPLIGLGGVAYVLTQQNLRDVLLVLGIGLVSQIHYFAYIHPRRDSRWVLLEAPVEAGETGAGGAAADPALAVEPADI